MPYVPGLRTCYAKVGRLVYFGRMLDKIRLHAAGKLPPDYHNNLGIGFDGRCCTFLGVDYPALKTRTLEGGADVRFRALGIAGLEAQVNARAGRLVNRHLAPASSSRTRQRAAAEP